MLRAALILLTAACTLGPAAANAGDFPKFEHKVVDPHVGDVCYAVTLADVNTDGKQDIVAVSENRVLWYAQPTWKKHVIIADQTVRDNVCISPADINRDGKVEFGLGAGWTEVGTIQWLSRSKESRSNWNVHAIGKEKWLHRMRFADVLGKGEPQLVISPLNATVADGVRLTALEIPENPKTDPWKRHVMDGTLNRLHNHWHVDFDGDGLTDTLTASREGIHLIRRSNDDWTKKKLAAGYPGKKENRQGAGEVQTGRLTNGEFFIVAIEPMHGTDAVVYTKPAKSGQLWQRHVLDDTLKQGHAVWTADLDGKPGDEVIIGHREKGTGKVQGPGLYVFEAQNKAGTKWKRYVIDDGGMATEDAIAADLTGDGRVDIIAGGRATHNVKLYVNRAAPSH